MTSRKSVRNMWRSMAARPTSRSSRRRKRRCRRWLGGYNVDLAHPCHYNIKRWKDGKVIQAFDTSRIPEYGNIWERFRTIQNTSFDGKPYFIPWDAGTVVDRLPHRPGGSRRCRRSVLGAAVQREVQGPAVDVRHRHHLHRNRRAHFRHVCGLSASERRAARPAEAAAGEAEVADALSTGPTIRRSRTASRPASWWRPMPGAAPTRR